MVSQNLVIIGSDNDLSCHLIGTKPLSEAMLTYGWVEPQQQINQNSNIFFRETAFEIRMAEQWWLSASHME